MGGAWQREAEAAVIREFLKLLAVCHTVIPEGTPQLATIKYQACRALALSSLLFGEPCAACFPRRRPIALSRRMSLRTAS